MKNLATINWVLEGLIKDTQSSVTGTHVDLKAFKEHIISEVARIPFDFMSFQKAFVQLKSGLLETRGSVMDKQNVLIESQNQNFVTYYSLSRTETKSSLTKLIICKQSSPPNYSHLSRLLGPETVNLSTAPRAFVHILPWCDKFPCTNLGRERGHTESA